MNFYDRLNSLIKANGLSQRKLEIELGLSNGAISKWKKYSPNAEKVQLIAKYFNVTVEYLMTGNESVKKESDASSEELDIEKDIDKLIVQMKNSKESGKLTYRGIELSDVEVEIFRQDLIMALSRLREYNRLINSKNSEKGSNE